MTKLSMGRVLRKIPSSKKIIKEFLGVFVGAAGDDDFFIGDADEIAGDGVLESAQLGAPAGRNANKQGEQGLAHGHDRPRVAVGWESKG